MGWLEGRAMHLSSSTRVWCSLRGVIDVTPFSLSPSRYLTLFSIYSCAPLSSSPSPPSLLRSLVLHLSHLISHPSSPPRPLV